VGGESTDLGGGGRRGPARRGRVSREGRGRGIGGGGGAEWAQVLGEDYRVSSFARRTLGFPCFIYEWIYIRVRRQVSDGPAHSKLLR
jgi:hypothetical protein